MTSERVRDCVLIVDDDPDYREMLSQWIVGAHDVDVIVVENGIRALNYLRTEGRPSLVLTDLRMPVMGGIALIDEMLNDRTLGATPVILLSGDDFTGTWRENLVAVLKKPCAKEALLQVIGSVLSECRL